MKLNKAIFLIVSLFMLTGFLWSLDMWLLSTGQLNISNSMAPGPTIQRSAVWEQ
jgi:hypothetical protein